MVFGYDHTEVLTWRHFHVFQHRGEITCRLPRGKCRPCGHVFRLRPPWERWSTHFTREFEACALLLMRKVGELVGETDTRWWRMLFRQVDAACAEADFSQVGCVEFDEMSVRKGHEYISVFADLVRKRVLFATEGKDKEQERMAKIKDQNLGTTKAYQMRRILQDIYRSANAGIARHRFQVGCRWGRWVARFHKASRLASLVKLAQMIENHWAGILAHWKWGGPTRS